MRWRGMTAAAHSAQQGNMVIWGRGRSLSKGEGSHLVGDGLLGDWGGGGRARGGGLLGAGRGGA